MLLQQTATFTYPKMHNFTAMSICLRIFSKNDIQLTKQMCLTQNMSKAAPNTDLASSRVKEQKAYFNISYIS